MMVIGQKISKTVLAHIFGLKVKEKESTSETDTKENGNLNINSFLIG